MSEKRLRRRLHALLAAWSEQQVEHTAVFDPVGDLTEVLGGGECGAQPPAVEALIAAAREIVAYGAAGGPDYLFWEEKYSALERALSAVDKEAP